MIEKTQGISLSYIRYKDTSIIVRIFTREFGLRSYLVNSVRKKNKGNKLIFFQPLQHLDLVIYENPKKDINRISDIKFFYAPKNILTDIKRSSVILFLSEFLEKYIITEEEHKELFDFIANAIHTLDKSFDPNFLIGFLLELSEIIGFKIDVRNHIPSLAGFFRPSSEELHLDKLTSDIRKEIIFEILDFYKINLEKNDNLKSLPILVDVLHS